MAIEWIQEPAWGWGDYALPIDLDSLYRRILTNYTSDNAPIIEPYSTYGGWYMARIGGLSFSRYNCGENIAGYAPGSCVGNEIRFEKTLLTIYFPNADARFVLNYKVSYLAQYMVYDVQITTKWKNGNGDDISQTISGASFSVNPQWTNDWTVGQITFHPGYPCQFAVTSTKNGETLYGATVATCGTYSSYGFNSLTWGGEALLINIKEFAQYLQEQNPGLDFGTWEVEDPYSPEAGEAAGSGGYGGIGGDPTASDSPQFPSDPIVGASGLGFINMYNPSLNGLNNLGSEIFPDFSFSSIVDPTGNTVIDAILNACGAFVDCLNQIPTMFEMFINSRLIDYVQDCHIIPVAPVTGAADHIKLGFRSLETTAAVVTSDYVNVDCGSISLVEMRGQFMDYQPYTRAKLFLPFVGFVPMEPEYWQNGALHVKYKFNVYDGSFIACIMASPDSKVSKMSDAVVAQYCGTAIVHIPLTGLNYSSMVSGLIGSAGAMATAIGSGNPAAAATAAINAATASPQVMTSNGYTASASFLGYRYPFILIERTKSHFAMNYTHDLGLPSYITTTLGAQTGFQVVRDVDLTGVDAMESEKEEIRKLLASGIYC